MCGQQVRARQERIWQKKVETGFVGGSSCAGQALAEDARFSWDYRTETDPWDLIGEDCWCLGLVQ